MFMQQKKPLLLLVWLFLYPSARLHVCRTKDHWILCRKIYIHTNHFRYMSRGKKAIKMKEALQKKVIGFCLQILKIIICSHTCPSWVFVYIIAVHGHQHHYQQKSNRRKKQISLCKNCKNAHHKKAHTKHIFNCRAFWQKSDQNTSLPDQQN